LPARVRWFGRSSGRSRGVRVARVSPCPPGRDDGPWLGADHDEGPGRRREVTVSCAALLAVQPVTREDGQRATQALRSLVADGWTIKQLADTTGLTVRAIGRTINGHTTPAPAAPRPSSTRSTSCASRTPPTVPLPCGPATAVNTRGGTRLHRPEPTSTISPSIASPTTAKTSHSGRPSSEALQRLAGQYPDIEIGRRLGMSARTVLRHRASQGLPACRPVPAKAPPDDHRLRPPPRASITPG